VTEPVLKIIKKNKYKSGDKRGYEKPGFFSENCHFTKNMKKPGFLPRWVMRNRVSEDQLCHSTKRIIETRFLAPMGDEKPGFFSENRHFTKNIKKPGFLPRWVMRNRVSEVKIIILPRILRNPVSGPDGWVMRNRVSFQKIVILPRILRNPVSFSNTFANFRAGTGAPPLRILGVLSFLAKVLFLITPVDVLRGDDISQNFYFRAICYCSFRTF